MSYDKSGDSNGAQDIDEFFFEHRGVTVHIEKTAPNEYFIGIDAPGKRTATMFIGRWPKLSKRELLLDIVENTHGRWHF